MKRLFFLPVIAVLGFMMIFFSASAVAATTAPVPHPLVFGQAQIWAIVIGVFTPIVGYILNWKVFIGFMRQVPEEIRAMTHVAIAAIGTVIYEAACTNSLGFNLSTLELIGSAVAAAFIAHGIGWKPSGVTARLTVPRATAPAAPPPSPPPAPAQP